MVAVHTLWGPIVQTQGLTSGVDTQLLNDSDNSVAGIYPILKDGEISQLAYYITALTGTPPQFNIGLVTVDSSGNPTTTAYGGSATTTHTPVATGLQTVTLGTPATGVAGEYAAVRIWPGGTPPDGSNNITVITGQDNAGALNGGLPTTKEFGTGWTAGNDPLPGLSYKYTDGEWASIITTATMLSTAFDSADTPDEYGAYFTVPLTFTCRGCRIVADPPSAGNTWTVTLYDTDGASVLATKTMDTDLNSNLGFYDVFWDGVELTAGGFYRLSVKSDSGTATMQIWHLVAASAALREAFSEGDNWQLTTRTDAGAWSQTDTHLPMFGVWVSDIAGAGGAGGGATPNVSRVSALGYQRGY